MAKIHELLAVEGQLKGQAEATRTDLKATFEKKRHLFEKKVVTFTPLKEGASSVTEQQSDLHTTVPQELKWIQGVWAKALDVSYAVAHANTLSEARADVVLDSGVVLLPQVPTTALLELEKRASEIEDLIKVIPTLDPAKSFTLDTAQGHGVFKARVVEKPRTAKMQRPIVLYNATPEHPAQTQLISEDVPTGHVSEQEWSGLLTVKQKGDMIERAEELRRAVKAARMRANNAELKDAPTCGKKLFDFVFDVKA